MIGPGTAGMKAAAGRMGTAIGELDAYWLPGEGLWLIAPEWNAPLERLRGMLFGRHAASWYGESVGKHQKGALEGLLLSPLLAMDYMAEPGHLRLIQVSWSPRAELLRRTAQWIRRAMLSGWYAPDLAGWSEGKRRWSAAPPGAEEAARRQWTVLMSEAAALGLVGVEGWLGEAVEEVIASEPEAADALLRLNGRTGADLSARTAADEDDWLVGIGWKPDETPFRTALQLVEPDGREGWRLRVMLRERSEPERTVRLARGESGAWQAESGEPPAEWERWLGPKLAKEEAKWTAALPELAGDAGNPAALRLALSEEEAWRFLQDGSVRLLQAGCPVMLPAWWEAARSRRMRLRAKVKSSVGTAEQPMFGLNQIVDFDWKLAVGDIDLSEEELVRLAADNRRLLNVRGEWVHLDPNDVKLIREWMKRKGKSKGMSFRDVLEWHLRGGLPLQGYEEDGTGRGPQAEIELNAHLASWLERLQRASELPVIDKPEGFRGELRPYQLEGVSWLAFLRQFGLGGCLADDMGLGKTIQFTAYLLHVKKRLNAADAEHAPSLLICPTSVIGNWEKELERFAPGLKVHIHYGARRMKGVDFADSVRDADLVITSYALAPLDEDELGAVDWDTLCLDEAQNIKNVYTKQSSAIRRLNARHRIAMTGTPMENRLTELWSIHDFMNPGYLGNLTEFRREVVAPIEKTREEGMIRQLQQWVKPFMLRRLKKDPNIRLALPDKNEQKTYVSLTAEQGALYENTVTELLNGLDGLNPMQRRGLILAALTKLKQLCDHPSLTLGDVPRRPERWDSERSGKVTRLLEMVDEVAAEGERCLIFTQFVDMGAMLKAQLEKRLGLPVPYLHGGVPKKERDVMIERFQNPELPGCAFVLSLKAGGTGLNLTAANHVFHFDRWWNPAVENQATDRAFRIGQTKDVQVHKFITIGTLEERIDDMLSRKQSLNEQVVGQSEGWITELDKDELRALFTLRRSRLHS
ncbi:MAG TPA: DEAD/DEAH box helicase [Paenibacillus sp.]|uniref:DEAD/DEAH box helicase n=1 Tax=Paenibacillus sp. TaxID=58172 RepID=UPI002C006D33|nr:DEAD/DEAH box helicase [Paenibacillus sp.]HUC93742.1 DEAD/DEAH box helicase [Paenibacillus sp.]